MPSDFLPLQELTQFHFLRPQFLWLLTVPVLLLWLIGRLSRQQQRTGVDIAPHLQRVLTVRNRKKAWWTPENASLLALLFAVLAMAGPSWYLQEDGGGQAASDVIIVISLADSMLQDDVKPTRLHRAQQKIDDFVRLKPAGNVALLVYADSAYQVTPFTPDVDIILNFSRVLTPSIMPQPGDDASSVLPLLDSLLKSSPELDYQPYVLWISDGISTEATSAMTDFIRKQDMAIGFYGVGGNQADSTDGAQAFDEISLKQLAQLPGAFYQRLSISGRDIEQLQKPLINPRRREYTTDGQAAQKPEQSWQDMGYYLLPFFMLIFLLWFRRGWSLTWLINGKSLLLLLLLLLINPLVSERAQANSFELPDNWLGWWLSADQQGQWYFNHGDYEKAAAAFDNLFHKAQAWYFAEEFASAASEFAKLDSRAARFNRANALAQGRQYSQAVVAYEKLLQDFPAFTAAGDNLRIVRKIVRENAEMAESQQQESEDSSQALEQGDKGSGGAEDKLGRNEQSADASADDDAMTVETDAPAVAEGQLSAQQILADEAIQKQWMTLVQQDPADFLEAKFRIQQSRRQSSEGSEHKGENR
ncbi:VWA domain-containing protein [Endozoicomonas sp.]|uniref:VWA domain-containing protein n=1 Tax=Endozoicomonas sp. TaxID=1892382 RepID=UPI00383BF4F4